MWVNGYWKVDLMNFLSDGRITKDGFIYKLFSVVFAKLRLW